MNFSWSSPSNEKSLPMKISLILIDISIQSFLLIFVNNQLLFITIYFLFLTHIHSFSSSFIFYSLSSNKSSFLQILFMQAPVGLAWNSVTTMMKSIYWWKVEWGIWVNLRFALKKLWAKNSQYFLYRLRAAVLLNLFLGSGSEKWSVRIKQENVSFVAHLCTSTRSSWTTELESERKKQNNGKKKLDSTTEKNYCSLLYYLIHIFHKFAHIKITQVGKL